MKPFPLLAVALLLSGATHLTRPQRQAIRACRQECRATVLFPTTTTTVTCPTTSSTTTSTTLPWTFTTETPCGTLRLRGDYHFEGELVCAAGTDTFEGLWPLAPPPASAPVRGTCTGTAATFVQAPSTLTLTCTVCCAQGMTVTR